MNSQQAAAVLGFEWPWCSVMQCGFDGVVRGGGEDAQAMHSQLHPESDLQNASQEYADVLKYAVAHCNPIVYSSRMQPNSMQ